MNKFSLLFASMILASSVQLFAQGGAVSTDYVYDSVTDSKVAKGFTVSLIKDFTDLEIKGTGLIRGLKFDENSPQKFGLGVGYSNVNIGAIGFVTQAIINSYSGDIIEGNMLKGEFNGTFGFNRNVFVYGGINLGLISIDDINGIEFDSKLGFGYQAGVGAQLTSNFGAKLGYTYSKPSVEASVQGVGDVGFDFTFSGLELGLVGTF